MPALDALNANTYIATYKRDVVPVLTKLLNNPQIHVDTLVLSNISALVGPNLPHEFESALGKIFALGRRVVMIQEQNQQNRYRQYFSHWQNDLSTLPWSYCSTIPYARFASKSKQK